MLRPGDRMDLDMGAWFGDGMTSESAAGGSPSSALRAHWPGAVFAWTCSAMTAIDVCVRRSQIDTAGPAIK